MLLLDFTFPTPAQNLACDEILLDRCERGNEQEILRFWESPTYFVVLGYTKPREKEANVPVCEVAGIPILRRCTGGGTVLQGPGCLNYSLILRIDSNVELDNITGTNRFIMERQRAALEALLGEPVSVQGFTDLVWRERKFSGNAQRRRQKYLLFHGTLLLDFDLNKVEEFLLAPEQQPAYRAQRRHSDFIANLKLPAEAVKANLQTAWEADTVFETMPLANIELLAHEKYENQEWLLKF